MKAQNEMKEIKAFEGEYRWLSNFASSTFVLGNVRWLTVEHFYQAVKTTDLVVRTRIRLARTPSIAKKMGRNVVLRANWEEIKEDVMFFGLRAKFKQNKDLKQKLLNTGTSYLQEGNHWCDKYWGVCLRSDVGQNRLGHLLMKVRKELQEQNNNER